VEAVHPTFLELTGVCWRIEDGDIDLDATAPIGAPATVVRPLHPDGRTGEVDTGKH